VALAGFRSEPWGYVASYSIFPHSETDVLNFRSGSVTLQTCCGEEAWGTYARLKDGTWVWHRIRPGTNGPMARDFLVRSDYFSMTFTDTQSPSNVFTLRRRVFMNFPL